MVMLFYMTAIPWSYCISWWPCHDHAMTIPWRVWITMIMPCDYLIVMFDYGCQPGWSPNSQWLIFWISFFSGFNIHCRILVFSAHFCNKEIIHSTRCVFLTFTCHLSRQNELEDSSHFEKFYSSNYSKFAIECTWNSKFSQIHTKVGFLQYR